MATVCKLTLLSLLVFILISNAKANRSAHEEEIVHGNSLASGSEYNVVVNE